MIDTRPSFIFGHIVTLSNNAFAFDEGSGELIAEVEPGGYSFAEFALALSDAMTEAGTQRYSVSVDRQNLRVTISAAASFDLLIDTGSPTNSGYSLAGFTGADVSGVTSATGDSASGFKYRPQFLVQSYVSDEHIQESAFHVLNRSQSGKEELIRFGVDKYIEMEILFVTNKTMDGVVIRNNPNGVEDAVRFLQYATQKQRMELALDENSPNTFKKVILSSTPSSTEGVGYRLNELLDKGLRDVYDIGLLRFRVVG